MFVELDLRMPDFRQLLDEASLAEGSSYYGGASKAIRSYMDRGAKYWALVTDKPVALCAVKPSDKLVAITSTGIISVNVTMLTGLYVLESERGKGYARKCMERRIGLVKTGHLGMEIRADYVGERPVKLDSNLACWDREPVLRCGLSEYPRALIDSTPSIHPEALPTKHLAESLGFKFLGVQPYDNGAQMLLER